MTVLERAKEIAEQRETMKIERERLMDQQRTDLLKRVGDALEGVKKLLRAELEEQDGFVVADGENTVSIAYKVGYVLLFYADSPSKGPELVAVEKGQRVFSVDLDMSLEHVLAVVAEGVASWLSKVMVTE